ncbi:MAG: response regulator [Candidatus Manganitrophaceae bacterium]|nr:MAG: response regulator [Candidatus Manganitrophaceae bacterium]
MSTPLHVIIVETPREDVELLLVELCRGGYEVTCAQVNTAADMSTALSEMEWDIVFANYNALVICPFAALKVLQENGFDLPLIVFSDHLDEDASVRSMKAGARDYILKNDLKRLFPVIERELREREARRDRKQTEHALRESERRFRSLVASSPVGIFEIDTAGRCLYVNERAAELVGLSVDECLGFGWIQTLFGTDRSRVEESWREAIRAGRSFQEEYRFQREDSTIAWVIVQVAAITNAEGRHAGFIGTLTDIADRKQAEETSGEERLRLMEKQAET